jgi:hypothetical protein
MKRTATFAAGLAATALLPAVAYARADSAPFHDSFDGTETGLVDECFGGTGGVLTGHGDITGRSTENANTFAVHGLEIDTVRIDFSDGSTFVGGSRDRFAFVITRLGTSAFTDAHVDGGTTYAADGTALGRTTFRATEHFTIVDRAPAGPGPEDLVRVQFERGRLTCS